MMSDVPLQGSKKRRLHGACDGCRARKIKCDSAHRPGNKCTNCIVFDTACTHIAVMSRKNRASATGSGSAAIIEDIQVHISNILSTETPYTVPKDTSIVLGLITELARYARSLENQIALTELNDVVRRETFSVSPQLEGEDVHLMEGPMSRLDVGEDNSALFGGTPDSRFLMSAKIMKQELNPSHDNRRPEFWYPHPWQILHTPERQPLQFPPADLVDALVFDFLDTTNHHLCFIHGPTLLRQIASGLHHTSHAFGSVVLAICALASRNSTDPRVGGEFSAGWAWFQQLRPIGPGERIVPETSLWDLQLFPLMVVYAYGLTLGEQCWNLTGMGLRICEGMYIHRLKRKKGLLWTVKDELLKRVWWALVALDVYTSSLGGKPRMANIDQFDAEYPLEVNDEFWPGEVLADLVNPWTQPEGFPCDVTSWVLHLKILEIFGFAQMTIYSVRRSMFWDSLSTAEWHQNVAVELDSALNRWLDSIPDFLRWDPQAPKEAATVLYTTYYWVQIQIHRPFLRAKTPLSSIAICATAARSCAHIIHVHDKAFGTVPLTTIMSSILHSSIVLLMNAKNGLAGPRDLEDVKLSMQALAKQEGRFQVAGRYHDIIRELVELVQTSRNGGKAYDPRKRKDRPDDWESDSALDFFGVEVNPSAFELWDTWNSTGWQEFIATM